MPGQAACRVLGHAVRDQSLPGELEIGAFSISLAVADLAKSQAFYERLGFVVVDGDAEAEYLILKNGETPRLGPLRSPSSILSLTSRRQT